MDDTTRQQRTRSVSLTLVVPLYNESHRVLAHAEALERFVAGYSAVT